jgi:hypothetical protein
MLAVLVDAFSFLSGVQLALIPNLSAESPVILLPETRTAFS